MSGGSFLQVLRQALAVARLDPAEALRILDAGLDDARTQGDVKAITMLAKHAGAISSGSHDFHRALAYLQEARSHSDDGYIRIAIGTAYQDLGNIVAARNEYAECLRVAQSCGDISTEELASAALKHLK